MKSVFVVLILISIVTSTMGGDMTRCVNPFIGTGKYGHTFPGAVRPWGMVSVSPHNAPGSTSGYIYGEKYFYGFGYTHLSGTGCPDLGGIILNVSSEFVSPEPERNKSTYSEESASPGYYRVRLIEPNLIAEVTATIRCGMTRLTALSDDSCIILIDAGRSLALVGGGSISIISNGEIEGFNTSGGFCGEMNRQRVYFVAQLSKPGIETGVWCGDTISPKQVSIAPENSSVGAWLRINLKKGESLIVKIGISYVSSENARLNLNHEIPDWDFDRVKEEARLAWENELSRIRVEGGSADDSIKFYSAMYHMLLHPNIISDVTGEYPLMGRNGIGKYSGRDRYSVFSLWDTYRTLHPFLTLVFPERQSDIVKTMIDMYKESGWLPKWELAGNETHMMVGDPAPIVISDTYIKGIRDFDTTVALKAMTKPYLYAGEKSSLPARPGYKEFLEYGYIPFDQDTTEEWWVWGPASVTLEYCLADWSIEQIARGMGHLSLADSFRQQAFFYRNLFDPTTKFIRPRRKNGEWLQPFDPLAIEGSGSWGGSGGPGYVEGNAWQYTWFVPHDMGGLIRLFGDTKNYVKKLDSCFTLKQFYIGNEPDIAYPYLFTYIPGEEVRTQKYIREIMSSQFGVGPDGLPGDDDCGTISAWYVFSSLGFYPDCPASSEYRIGLPLFQKATIDLNSKYFDGDNFVIKKKGEKGHVKRLKLNGNKLDRFWISHSEIIQGGSLVFEVE